jgi:hypothetical protein
MSRNWVLWPEPPGTKINGGFPVSPVAGRIVVKWRVHPSFEVVPPVKMGGDMLGRWQSCLNRGIYQNVYLNAQLAVSTNQITETVKEGSNLSDRYYVIR